MQPGQHIRDLQSQLSLALGTRVDVKQSAKGRGRITLHFASHEEFDRLRDVLMQSPTPQTGTM
jgi:ParB family chromosome partitioning protein